MIKFVFVCPDVSFMRLQYRDFQNNGNRLVTIGGIERKIIKIVSWLGITKFKLFDFLIFYQLRKSFSCINTKINERYCFILYSRVFEDFNSSICRFLRKNFRNCYIVVYYGDLIERHKCSIDDIKASCDLVCTFDENEAQKYDIDWILEPFSSSIKDMDIFSVENNPLRYDITFVGRAKNRYKKIIELYEKLTSYGYSCDFHITGVPENMRKYKDRISYEGLTFTELLRHVLSSKCIAEIMQDNGSSPTTRYTEAMIFEKNLITNCGYFCDERRRTNNIFYFKDIEDIDKFKNLIVENNSDFNKEDFYSLFSINSMINAIQKKLKIRKLED